MKQILSEFDRDSLEMRIAAAEKRTQVQIVLAVIRRCDNYTEIPWKAFGFGASIAGLAVFLFHLLLPDWITHTTVLLSVAVILASGATFALLTVFFLRFARLFLSSHRAYIETKQYAESLFLAKELFATKGRNGILLLVGLFERKVILYPDKGLSSRLSEDDMQAIIDGMVQFLSRKEVRAAMESGLEGLIRLLESASSANPFSNELSNKIIEEEGV